MSGYTQENRLIQVATPLGEDVLLLQRFSGTEAVSRLFRFDLTMFSENRSIDHNALIGKNATIKMILPDGSERFFNGIISSFGQGAAGKHLASYRATLVPWFWLLSRTSNCRIFQEMTVPDIIEKIFKESGFSDYKNKLHGSYQKREYCVQYRETSLNFISRLMEHEGIFYYFEHEEKKHHLVLADNKSEFKTCPLQDKASFNSVIGEEGYYDIVQEWLAQTEVRPGKYTVVDFDFEKPTTDLTATIEGSDQRKYEIYDFPGEYVSKSEGERIAGIRMHEQEVPQTVFQGSSTCQGFVAGYKFELADHYRREYNKSYALLSVYHEADQGDNFETEAGQAGFTYQYSNRFTCIRDTVAYRPERITPVPVVYGSQSAIVVGPSGEEIYVDKYGRVKVQFHWDREGKYNDKSSCWMRVSQIWTGKRWGAMFIPRIGTEVVVDFFEGDPDRPYISGRVYNAMAMPPYALPDEKTKSTIKSYSSKGGGGFNEIRFEDKKGQEQIFIHAQRNKDLRVTKDRMEHIGNDSHLIVKNDQFEKVEGDKHTAVSSDLNEKVGGTVSMNAGQDIQEKAGMKYAMDAGMEIHLKAGTNVVVEAGTTLTMKVGGNFININPGGIFIKGTMVMLNSGGAAGSGAGSSPNPPVDPKVADTADPGEAVELPPPKKPLKPVVYSPAALMFKQAARSGAPFCDILPSEE